ncbi:MAG TPA: glycoside hydrolase family 20 zincin-like fold domain-containing protein [Kiritimatiellia bacterium]|nr:glycoside hydrolase family 20 zincin-like fold domain-containing protein [Kiritimatiellia bacterium]
MNSNAPVLLPQPRHLVLEQGALTLRDRRCTIHDASGANDATAHRIRQDLRHELRLDAELLADTDKGRAATILLNIDATLPAQGYSLHVTPRHIALTGADAAGLFHVAMTLRQLVRQYRDAIPACRIEDHPDFPVRGVMLDISRDKVPTMDTMFRLVEELAEWKINHLELYTEHTFAYRNHRAVWAHASPMTAEEVRELDAFCAERQIELVPNQNCFGHLHRWLEHEPYKALAEAPDGFMTPWGEPRNGPFSLNPLDPRSLAFVEELLAELLPNFRSRRINVGCDETFDLGQGRSREACETEGKGRVYLDFLLKIHAAVSRHGHTMHFWGDIILNHPELIAELPRDVLPLVWGYEADHPFAAQCAQFADAGLPFYVCPGTSTWCSIAGRTDNALANLDNAVENGLAHGASGYLITSWGDHGHWQPYAIDLLPFAAGAARAWCFDTNRDADLIRQLDQHVFRDEAGVLGQLAHDLGLVYRETGHAMHNASALFRLVSQRSIENLQAAIPEENLRAARERLRAVMAPLSGARSSRDDAPLLTREFEIAAHLIECGLARGLDEPFDREAILAAYRAQWLARNRPGGLDDSTAKLEA